MPNQHYYESPPLSPGSQSATKAYSVTDLSFQMSQYSLLQGECVDYLTSGPRSYDIPPSYDYSSDSSASPTEPRSPLSTYSLSPVSTQASSILTPVSSTPSQPSSGYHSTNVRQQRQRALRRQCSASHLREISALVSRMVNEGDQCCVSTSITAKERQNSDPTSDTSVRATHEYAVEDESTDSMEDEMSEPETFADPFEGYKIQEGPVCVAWNCPWTSRGRASDTKRCIKKDTSARKRGRRRGNPFAS